MIEQPPSLASKQLVLKAENLHKSFYTPAQVTILKGIYLEALRGDSIAIMGRSGEGKSTLLHILGTLEQPCKGSLTIAGHDVSHFNKAKIRSHHIGFIFQSFHLLEDYTVLENVLMPARIARTNIRKGSAMHQKAEHLLETVGLADRATFHTKLLSGGEKQRVAIARALCNDPDLILADEPSGNLDRQTSIGIHDLLLNFAKKNNKTLIVVTHDQELAKCCDHVYFLQEGVLHPK